ncbi:MAG: cold-shock protein [Bryobacteraceae bacterium]|nr:cold-shock protein [Bryobacteraceae bacterium]
MTGIIKSIGLDAGFIQLDDGRDLPFDFSAVLAYDLANLAAGQVVTFGLLRGAHPKAVDIVVQKRTDPSSSDPKRRSVRFLRYLGFEHVGNRRAYTFEEVVPGEQKKTYIVTTDVMLFKRHQVAMQEGPALCLRLLIQELDAGREPHCSLTDGEMLAHVARRPVPKTGAHAKRFSYTPGGGVRGV